MSILGSDFAGGLLRRMYHPADPASLVRVVLQAVVLTGLYLLLQSVLAVVAAQLMFGDISSERNIVKASLVIILPAALITAAVAVAMARRSGGTLHEAMNLHPPQLTAMGWAVLVFCFLVVMFAAILVIMQVFGINPAEYTPGPDGESPETGSAGKVKEAMFDIANEPWLFWLVLPSVALGAPIIEEVIFRGHLFNVLSQTRLGISGTSVVTAGLWSLLHLSEPWLSVGIIFVMGLIFGWMMYRFGSMWVTLACHGAWNAMFAFILLSNAGGAA